MKTALNSCPNCRSKATMSIKIKNSSHKYRVECLECWNCTKWYWNPEDAIEEWNRKVKDIIDEY